MSDQAENEKIEPPVSKKVHQSSEEPRNQVGGAKQTGENLRAADRPARKSASKLQGKLKNLSEEKHDPNDPDFEGNDEIDENDEIIEDDGEATSEHSDVKSDEFDLEDYLKFREADKEDEQNAGGADEEDEEEEEEEKPKNGKKPSDPEPAKKKRTFEDFDEDPK